MSSDESNRVSDRQIIRDGVERDRVAVAKLILEAIHSGKRQVLVEAWGNLNSFLWTLHIVCEKFPEPVTIGAYVTDGNVGDFGCRVFVVNLPHAASVQQAAKES